MSVKQLDFSRHSLVIDLKEVKKMFTAFSGIPPQAVMRFILILDAGI